MADDRCELLCLDLPRAEEIRELTETGRTLLDAHLAAIGART